VIRISHDGKVLKALQTIQHYHPFSTSKICAHENLITIFLLTLHLKVFCQDDSSDGDGTVTIDGWLSLLPAAGAGFSARSNRKDRGLSVMAGNACYFCLLLMPT
jgi:hypothetical protein